MSHDRGDYTQKSGNSTSQGLVTCFVDNLDSRKWWRKMLLLLSHFSLSDSVRPHRPQPTRLRHPWDSPGKNTGVGCHFLLQCMKVKGESEVAQLCPTPSDPMDCSLPGSSIHGIFQARKSGLSLAARTPQRMNSNNIWKDFPWSLANS